MSNDELSQTARSKWNKSVENDIRPAWTSNKHIFRYLQKQVSKNTNKFWLKYLFEDLIRRRFKNALSIGCGAGNHEIILSLSGLFDRIDAYDISDASIAKAKEKAKNNGIENINFFVANHETMVCDKDRYRSYDCVCFFGPLHHVRNIEEMLRYVFNLLTDDGLLVFQEYTGPLYTLLDEQQLIASNRILDCISDELRIDRGKPLSNPSIKDVYLDDPSEGVRSSLIIPLVDLYFNKHHLLPLSGVIVQKLYNRLDHDRLNDDSALSKTIIDLLFLIEDILVEDRRLSPTRHIGVYGPRNMLRPISVFGA